MRCQYTRITPLCKPEGTTRLKKTNCSRKISRFRENKPWPPPIRAASIARSRRIYEIFSSHFLLTPCRINQNPFVNKIPMRRCLLSPEIFEGLVIAPQFSAPTIWAPRIVDELSAKVALINIKESRLRETERKTDATGSCQRQEEDQRPTSDSDVSQEATGTMSKQRGTEGPRHWRNV